MNKLLMVVFLLMSVFTGALQGELYPNAAAGGGRPGATGATGPQGPAGSGGSQAFASLVATTIPPAAQTILAGDPVVFDATPNALEGNISYNGSTTLTLINPGFYSIQFGFRGSSVNIVQFAIKLDGSDIPGAAITSSSNDVFYSGSVIVQTITPSSLIELVNNDGVSSAEIASPTLNDAVAYLVVQQIQ